MRLLLLCEGDAETFDSWSGVSRSMLAHLRAAGLTVATADAELYGWRRLAVAGLSLGAGRRRWWVRYHLGRHGFRARSRVATRRVRNAGPLDLILQVGATFEVADTRGAPLVLYCDSNIVLAARAAGSGLSEASVLTPAEIDEIRVREARVVGRASLIFCMSDLVRRSFIDDFGVPPARLVTVHCAPNVVADAVGDTPRPADRPPTVLFVGRDFTRKGGALMLEAFAAVRRVQPDARLRMVGVAPPGLEAAGVEWLGLLSRDTESGRAAMDAAYRTADVFCLPTRFEPFGTAFVEAMSYGLPVVAPDRWALPEIVEHGTTGLLVAPDDPGAYAEAVLALLRDPARARSMGTAGRARVLERFTWPGIADRMVAAMRPLAATRPSGP